MPVLLFLAQVRSVKGNPAAPGRYPLIKYSNPYANLAYSPGNTQIIGLLFSQN
jgi:hypothetical protein